MRETKGRRPTVSLLHAAYSTAGPHAHPSLPGLADGQGSSGGCFPPRKGEHHHGKDRTPDHRTASKAGTCKDVHAAATPAASPATTEESRADIYQRITDRIAAAIETGAGEWRMPWHPGADGAAPVLPVNAATGRPYRGVNTVVLWATAQAEGYPRGHDKSSSQASEISEHKGNYIGRRVQ